jgi:hypothetical protein
MNQDDNRGESLMIENIRRPNGDSSIGAYSSP